MKNIRLLKWGGISGLTPGEMFSTNVNYMHS